MRKRVSNTHLSLVLTSWKVTWLPLNARDVDKLGYRPSLSPCMYLPTAADDSDQYQHLPAMSGPSAMRFHSFTLAILQLYITCTFNKSHITSEQLILGPNACSTLSSSLYLLLVALIIFGLVLGPMSQLYIVNVVHLKRLWFLLSLKQLSAALLRLFCRAFWLYLFT